MACFTNVAFCLVLLFALANCRTFEDAVHNRSMKTIKHCHSFQMGTDWPGNDLHDQPITNATDAPSCCLECNRLFGSDVKAFVFQTDLGQCHCKSRAASPIQCPVCQGSSETIPDPAPRCRVTRGVDSYGYDLRGPIEDVTRARDCCSHCRQYGPQCVAWMWRRDYSRCYLKSITVPFTNCTECIFGTP